MTLPERGQVEVPLDLFLSNGKLSLNPALEHRKFLDIQVKRDRLTLSAGKYIGFIPVNSQLAINVRPKVPLGKLARILGVARESPILIRELAREYSAEEEIDVLELLVAAFSRELRVLEQLGPIKQYRRSNEVGQAIRGRINLKDAFTNLWPAAVFDKASYEYFEYSPDNALNQAMEYTIWHLLRVYAAGSQKLDINIVRNLREAHRYFARIQPDRQRAFLPTLRAHLRVRRPDEPYASFHALLSLCLMILDDLGVELDHEQNADVQLPPLVIDMELVFERLILNVLRDASRQTGIFGVWDTAREQQKPLFTESVVVLPDGIREVVSTEPARPDFTIAESGTPVLVGDSKYKTGHDVGDIYQVVTHAKAYGASNALLVYPAVDEKESVTFRSLGRIGEVQVFTCVFPMEVENLLSAGHDLLTGVAQILASRTPRLESLEGPSPLAAVSSLAS